MAITLGTLRQHCADLAHDAADSKASRVRMVWIRSALSRIHSAHDWKAFYATQRIVLAPEETGSDLTVTQDGNTFVRGSTWTAKYLSQLWDCMVDADGTQAFQFSAISTITATLASGQYWLQSSGSSKTYTMARYRYDMPTDYSRVIQVEDLSSYRTLRHAIVSDFDRCRNRYPFRRGQPELFTIRDPQYIELFPGNDATRRAVQVTYLRMVTLPADADVDATTIDWPDEYREVLVKALALEASVWLGQSARIPFQIAKAEYDEALRRCMSRDSRMVEISEEWSLGGTFSVPSKFARDTNGGIVDA